MSFSTSSLLVAPKKEGRYLEFKYKEACFAHYVASSKALMGQDHPTRAMSELTLFIGTRMGERTLFTGTFTTFDHLHSLLLTIMSGMARSSLST